MNEAILYTIAELGIALAGFSGVVIALLPGARNWTATELRLLLLLLGDSFLVVLYAILPVTLALTPVSLDWIWGVSNAALGSWFIVGNGLALRGEWRDRKESRTHVIPVITPVLYSIFVIASVMGIALWLAAIDVVVPRGQAAYVFGLITLLIFGALEFMYFIGRMTQQTGSNRQV
jgi:hypothetical protein